MEKSNLQPTANPLRLQIGDYLACSIPTGIFGLDGGAMFGTVPKVLWEKSNPPDEKNRIPMEARGLLLKSTHRNILIDCGNGHDFREKYGEKLGSKFAEMYGLDPNGPSLEKSLKLHNLTTDDITDVILTHLHFDHCGGGVSSKNGKLAPTFGNAKYWLQRKNLETAQNPNIREKASYLSANFEPLLEADVVNLLDGSTENILPGISVEISNGHTQGQQIVTVHSSNSMSGETLVYCGDLIPTSSHVRLAWIMGYDLDPLTLIEEKRQLLNKVADQSCYLYFEHDPYCNAATITRNGQDFALKARFTI